MSLNWMLNALTRAMDEALLEGREVGVIAVKYTRPNWVIYLNPASTKPGAWLACEYSQENLTHVCVGDYMDA